MASKEAIVQAYKLISANAPLVKADNDEDLAILLRSWFMALQEIDDNTLGLGVARFLKKVTEVNRSMVISAKLLELCKPEPVPFYEYEIIEVVAKLRTVGRNDVDELLKIKKNCDPLIWRIIENFGVDFIFNLTYEQLATVNAQLRDAYKQAFRKKQVKESNRDYYKLSSNKFGYELLEAK